MKECWINVYLNYGMGDCCKTIKQADDYAYAMLTYGGEKVIYRIHVKFKNV